MKRSFISVIFILTLMQLFSLDNSTDHIKTGLKAVHFSIGGGFNHSFSGRIGRFERHIINESSIYDKNEQIVFSMNLMPQNELIFSIPLSFAFFLNSKLGIGLTYSLGFYYNPGYYGENIFGISNKFRILNKLGDIDKTKFIILEYGLILLGNLYVYNFSPPPKISVFSIGSDLYYGPSLFIGYEKTCKNGFDYTVGGVMDVLMQFNDKLSYNLSNELDAKIKSFSIKYFIGVEFRFGYCITRKF